MLFKWKNKTKMQYFFSNWKGRKILSGKNKSCTQIDLCVAHQSTQIICINTQPWWSMDCEHTWNNFICSIFLCGN